MRMTGWTRHISRSLPTVIVLAAIVFATLASIRPIGDPDLFWHIHTGDWIRAHAAIPEVDSFSHTFAGRPLHLVDWLSDLLLSWVHSAGGLVGIEILSASLALAIMLVTVARTCRRHTPTLLITGGMLLIYAGSAGRIYSRPQTFGLLFASIEVLLLEHALSASDNLPSRRCLWLLLPLVCLWSNLHGSSPLGLVLLALFVAGDLWEHRGADVRTLMKSTATWLLLFCTTAGSMLLASNPIGRLEMCFALARSRFFHSVVTEWQPTEWQVLAGPIGLLGALVCIGLVLDARAVRAWEWLLVAFSGWLASTAWRFVPFFALVAGPVGLRHWARVLTEKIEPRIAKWRIADATASAAIVGAAFVIAFACNQPTRWLGGALRPTGGLARGLFPENAARFIARERPLGPVFNSFHWGGYLMWAVPDLRVFIDGRTETLYDDAFLKENTDLAPENWRELFSKYGVTWAVITPCPVEEDIASDPDWATVYFDDVAAILVRRTEPNAALVERLGYRFVTAEGLRKGTGPQNAPDMLAEAGRVVMAAPASGRAHLALANALLATGDEPGYEREAAEARRLAPYLGTVWFRIGIRHLIARRPGARLELARAVELAPLSTQFREMLALACLVEHDVEAAALAIAPILGSHPVTVRLAQLSASDLGRMLGIASPSSMRLSPSTEKH